MKTITFSKTVFTSGLTVGLLALSLAGCATDSTNGEANRDEATSETTSSRRAQGLDGSIRDPRAYGQTASNSDVTPQDAANGSVSGQALVGDATVDDEVAMERLPSNTSPTAVNERRTSSH